MDRCGRVRYEHDELRTRKIWNPRSHRESLNILRSSQAKKDSKAAAVLDGIRLGSRNRCQDPSGEDVGPKR